MNFQFTSKLKTVAFALMGIGVVLFILGFFGEKSHVYVTPYTTEGINLLQKNSFGELSHEEKIRFKEIGKGSTIEDANLLLVEYYHDDAPWSKEDFQKQITERAKEENVIVVFQDFNNHVEVHEKSHEDNHSHKHTHGLAEHDHDHATNDEENHGHGHEEMMEETHEGVEDHMNDHSEEAHADSHTEGNAEEAEKHEEAHHEDHGMAFIAMATAAKNDHKEEAHGDEHGAHHGGHGEAHHSPIETLEHIIHEEGTFADKHHGRTWSNLLVNAFFFFGIGLGALFFIGLQYATESGWGVVTKRILEAITGYLPIGMIPLLVVFIGASLHWNHIYHWMDPEVTDPNSPHFDAIIAGKQPFLGNTFFWIMNVVYFAVFLFFARFFRKRSLREDIEGGTKIHMGNYAWGAVFLVFFGYLSSVMSWHWIMSIDTHWFSTLFGWYVFSGIWISGTITILLMIFFLKSKGYLDFVNESHIHDFGKWLFAGSVLWAYLFFSQFMLIWYADIPEEVTYYVARFTDYKYLLWTTFAINLILPLVLLMSREAKRSKTSIVIIGTILLITHWLDVFIMVMPGTVFDHWDIGALEVGMFLFFAGLFIYVVFTSLTKAPLLVKNHPYLEENLHQHT